MFRALPPGVYDLRLELNGFSTFDRVGVIVTTGNTISIHVTPEMTEMKESITVIGESPTVNVNSRWGYFR